MGLMAYKVQRLVGGKPVKQLILVVCHYWSDG
jgi:hypothetical protein